MIAVITTDNGTKKKREKIIRKKNSIHDNNISKTIKKNIVQVCKKSNGRNK